MKFYVLQGDRIESFEESEIMSSWKEGTLKGTDFVRTEGSEEWTPLAKLLSHPSSNPISPKNDQSLTGIFSKTRLRQLPTNRHRQMNKLPGNLMAATMKQVGIALISAIAGIAFWAFYTGRKIVERVVDDSYIAPKSYQPEISGVLSQQSVSDIGARTVFQQLANGSYRYADMLAIIAMQLDARGDNSRAVNAIISQKALNDISAESALQQAANGTYRCVELLALIAREADRKKAYSREIESVLSQMSINDVSANSANQQIANATYCMAEMLAIACKAADRKNRFTAAIASALSEMGITEISSRTAPQQAANGLFTSAKLMALFGNLMDRKGTYAGSISAELAQMSINNISSETAFQQMANAYYRLTELGGYAAEGLNP
jgi:hypothetical protein